VLVAVFAAPGAAVTSFCEPVTEPAVEDRYSGVG